MMTPHQLKGAERFRRHRHLICVVLACAPLLLAESCWRPRGNGGGTTGNFRPPPRPGGPIQWSEASGSVAFSFGWDAEDPQLSIVGLSSDTDGRRGVSDIVTEGTIAEMSETLTAWVAPDSPDSGLDVDRLMPRTEECMEFLDAGPGGSCQATFELRPLLGSP